MDAKKYKMSGHTPLFLLDTIQYLLAFLAAFTGHKSDRRT
jgi:hypothetical protein